MRSKRSRQHARRRAERDAIQQVTRKLMGTVRIGYELYLKSIDGSWSSNFYKKLCESYLDTIRTSKVEREP